MRPVEGLKVALRKYLSDLSETRLPWDFASNLVKRGSRAVASGVACPDLVGGRAHDRGRARTNDGPDHDVTWIVHTDMYSGVRNRPSQ